MKKTKQILSVFLSFCMIISCMVGMSVTAGAATDTYTNLIPTGSETNVTGKLVLLDFAEYPYWYVIKDNSTAVDNGTITLLAYDPIGASEFHGSSNSYSGSTVETYLKELTASEGQFASLAEVIVPTDLSDVNVTDAKLFLLSAGEASALPENVRKCSKAEGASGFYWWLRSKGTYSSKHVAGVRGDNGAILADAGQANEMYGVRPDLSKVVFHKDWGNVFTLAQSTHTHSFTYSASGATITAACTDCSLTEAQRTLTISAPTSLAYDGTGKAATLSTGYDTTNAFPYVSAISYKKGSETLTGAPTEVGTYTASVSAGADSSSAVTASVTFTITKGTPNITTPPTASAITYGQTLANSTLSDGTASVPGTFSWKTPTTAPTVADSNSTEYDVVFTPTDTTNYNSAETKVKLTVNKADPTTPNGLTAKTGQTLADVTLPDGWSWVDDTTSVGEVGNNTFSAKYTDTTGNYNDKNNVELTVTVSSSVTYTRVAAKAATCIATGNKEYYKGSDGKYYTKSGDTYTETTLAAVTIAKTAHTLTAVAAVDAKCTTDGTKAHYKCSVCEKLFEDADGKTETNADALKVAKLGHNYVGGTCTRCGATDPNYGGNSGGYTPVIPSGGTTTTTTTTTTNTGSFADKTEENNNYAGAEINMKSDELEKAILTDEDKKVIAAGGNVTVELEVKETTPTAEEKKEIKTAVEAAKEASGEDYTVAMYFDANLFKTSNGTKTQLHETNGKIAVSFKLPAQFKNTDSSVTRTYAVARIHDGKTEILVCEYDPETDLLTFYTDKFSTYALMYEDAKADDVSAVDDDDDDDDEQADEGAVDDEQFDETDEDFDELTDDEGDFDDDFAEDQTDGDSDTDDDDQAAVDAAATTDDPNPNTGVSADFGLLAVCALTAGAALAVKKRKK